MLAEAALPAFPLLEYLLFTPAVVSHTALIVAHLAYRN